MNRPQCKCPPAAWMAGWYFQSEGLDIPGYAALARQHEDETGRASALTKDPEFLDGAAEAAAFPGW